MKFAFDPERPTAIVAKDGFTMPWRAHKSAGGLDAALLYRGWWLDEVLNSHLPTRMSDLDDGNKWPETGILISITEDYIAVPCSECDGSGVFVGPEDEQWVDVACRGRGWMYAGLAGQDFV